MRLSDQLLHILKRPVIGIDAAVIGDIIPVIAGGRVNRHQPDASNPQVIRSRRISVIQIIQFSCQPAQITDAVAV
ncbi:hypothetical protein D3C80_2165080 [compost metagenome]